MTVQELINALSSEDPQAQVHFAYNYGDHARTTVAPKAQHVETMFVKYSDYHQMDRLVDDEEVEDEDARPAVVIL